MITTKKISKEQILETLMGLIDKTPFSCWAKVEDSEDPAWNASDSIDFCIAKRKDYLYQDPDDYYIYGSNGQKFRLTLEEVK